MSKYHKRKSNLYSESSKNFPLSRSKIDLYIECPRCFYLDRKLGFGRPSLPGWSLNTAVDNLLKNEFDLYREKQEQHPIIKEFGIDAIPFRHEDLSTWRDDIHRYIGASVIDKNTGFKVQGIIDDIWINSHNELLIVDYKATSTSSEITLDDEYKSRYKRQMDIYQWIFRMMKFNVSSTGYFVFANGIKDNEKFNGRLEFDLQIIPYNGDDTWVSPTLEYIKRTLDSDEIPEASQNCEYCEYRKLIAEIVT